jgi:tetratricopeptide (TPR) repeat protein
VESFEGDLADLDTDLFTTIEGLAARLGRYLGLARKPGAGGAELAAGSGNRGSPAANVASSAASNATGGGPFDTRSLAALQHYQAGLSAFEHRDFPAATKHLEQAVAADSSLVRAYLLLAGMNPETENQMRLLGLAAKYSHGAPSPLPELVDAIWSEVYGRTDEAITRYETVLAQHPNEILARHALGALYLRRREWLKAIAEIEAARASNPFDYANYPSLITAQIELGQDLEAQELAQSWHRRMPTQPTPLMYWIGLESNLGRYPEALALCDTLAQVAGGWDLPDRSALLAELGRMRESNQVIARWAEHPGSYYSRSRPLTQRAWNDYLQGRYAPGRQLIAQALAIKNDYYNHWVAGLLAAGDGDLPRAEVHARTIAQLIQGAPEDTTNVEAYSVRRFYFNLQGEIASRRSDREAAVRAHRLAVVFSGRMDHPYFGTALGKALSQAGDQVGAAGAYERVLAINPNYPFALLGLGRTARATGDTAGARRRLERLDQVWSEADRDFSGRQELDELLHAVRSGSPPRRG